MIQCLNCKGHQVVEERIIPLPSGKLQSRWKWGVVIWLALSMFIFPSCLMYYTMYAGFLSIAIPAFDSIWEIGMNLLFMLFLVILLGPPLIYLIFVFFMTFAPGFYKKYLHWMLYKVPKKTPQPNQYHRFCKACSHQWLWVPGKRGKPGITKAISTKRQTPREKDASYSQLRSTMQHIQVQSYLPYLEELQAFWDGKAEPDQGFMIDSDDEALEFFEDYQRALGEPIGIKPGHSVTGYIRRYFPKTKEKRAFAGAYTNLRRGQMAAAEQTLRNLTRDTPSFADAWLWLTAVKNNPAERLEYLKKAIHLEPAHPLARDVHLLVQNKISLENDQQDEPLETMITIVRCPKCNGTLHYEPGESMIACNYCKYSSSHYKLSLLEKEAPLISTLRLKRQYVHHTWGEVKGTFCCQTCGAVLAYTQHLARVCAYCSSTNVIVQDEQRELMKPDGLVPFSLNRGQVEKTLETALDQRWGNIVSLEGIYMPCWVFDGIVDKQVLYLRNIQVVGTRLDSELRFKDLLFSGVSIPPPSMTDQLAPYDMEQLIPYEPRFLADWPAQLYDQDVEWVVEDAYDTMLSLAVQKTGAPVVSSANVPQTTKAAISFQVSRTTYQLILFPIWVIVTKQEKYRHLILVNGQTGKVVLLGQ
jgi:hypothetical protein